MTGKAKRKRGRPRKAAVETSPLKPKRSPGRPREASALRAVLVVRVSEETAAEIDRIAAEEESSRGKVARRLIEEGISGHP